MTALDLGRARIVGVLIGVCLVALAWVQSEASYVDPGLGRRLTATLIPIIAVTLVVAAATATRRPVLAAGVAVALAPSVLGQLAVSSRFGAVAVASALVGVAAAPLARRSRPLAALAIAGMVALGSASWYRATPERVGGPAPSPGDLSQQIGTVTRRAVGALGPDRLPVPSTAAVAWWLAVGLVVAAALLSRQRRAAAAPFVGLVVLLAAWAALDRWRGPTDPVGGVWLLSGALAYTAGRVELGRLPGRRVGAVALLSVGWAWVLSTAVIVRFSAQDSVYPAAWHRWRSWGSTLGGVDPVVALGVTAGAGVALAVAALALVHVTRDPAGVNVLGYHTITAGLGDRARELAGALEAAGVPVARVDLEVDSERDSDRLPDPAVRYASSVVVAPAFEVASIAERYPWAFAGRRIVAGYWFWELADVPESHHRGLEVVDEVWAPSRFVADAYRPVTSKPVRLVPLPVAEPAVAPIGRAELGFGEDEIVFVTSFSHLSVMERKNPRGVIEAFRRAFPPDGPTAPPCRLVVKSLNADRRPDDARRLAEAAVGDDRIQIRTDRVEHAELMALIAAADVLVSLHRSEGLGLHLAEAMWVGTPIIATDHSGSRDLLDRHCAELVPWRPTGVVKGDGAYPDGATWADPDLDAAAAAMRRLAADPERRGRLATVARDRIARQPDSRSAGRLLAKLARCPVPR